MHVRIYNYLNSCACACPTLAAAVSQASAVLGAKVGGGRLHLARNASRALQANRHEPGRCLASGKRRLGSWQRLSSSSHESSCPNHVKLCLWAQSWSVPDRLGNNVSCRLLNAGGSSVILYRRRVSRTRGCAGSLAALHFACMVCKRRHDCAPQMAVPPLSVSRHLYLTTCELASHSAVCASVEYLTVLAASLCLPASALQGVLPQRVPDATTAGSG